MDYKTSYRERARYRNRTRGLRELQGFFYTPKQIVEEMFPSSRLKGNKQQPATQIRNQNNLSGLEQSEDTETTH